MKTIPIIFLYSILTFANENSELLFLNDFHKDQCVKINTNIYKILSVNLEEKNYKAEEFLLEEEVFNNNLSKFYISNGVKYLNFNKLDGNLIVSCSSINYKERE